MAGKHKIYSGEELLKQPGIRISQINLAKLLEENKSNEALLRIGDNHSWVESSINKEWSVLLDMLQSDNSWHSILPGYKKDRQVAGSLNLYNVIEIKDDEYRRGSVYNETYVIGIKKLGLLNKFLDRYWSVNDLNS